MIKLIKGNSVEKIEMKVNDWIKANPQHKVTHVNISFDVRGAFNTTNVATVVYTDYNYE